MKQTQLHSSSRRKKALCILNSLFFLLLLAPSSFSQPSYRSNVSLSNSSETEIVLANWDFLNKGGESSVEGSNLPQGVGYANVALGEGMTAMSYLYNGLTAKADLTTTLDGAIAANDYISIIITPTKGYCISISSITITPVSQNRSRTFALLSSTDEFTSEHVLHSFSASANQNGIPQTISLSNQTNLMTSVEYRLYIYGNPDQYESVGIGNRSGIDLEIKGSIVDNTGDVEPPTKATNLSASNITTSGFDLAWDASTDNIGVSGYDVIIGGEKQNENIITRTYYSVTNLENCTSYDVVIKAYDVMENYLLSTEEFSVKTNCIPVAVLTASDEVATAPGTITFDASGSYDLDGADDIISYEWDFNDGYPKAYGANVSHTFIFPRDYTVTLQVKDNNGNYSEPVTKIISIHSGVEGTDTIPKLNIGMNVSNPAYYTTNLTYTDVMSTAGGMLTYYSSSGWNTEQINQIPRDENGYPLKLPYNIDGNDVMVRMLINNYYKGRYYFLYDGEGSFTIHGLSHGVENGKTYIDFNGQGGNIWFQFTSSAEGNHLRNMRILPAEYVDATDYPLFLPQFLDGLRPFHTLRFMDWIGTNNSKDVEWADRTTPTYYRGAPSFENAIALCNELNANAWVCIPHMASDDYIQKTANLWKENLKPGLKIYVEYSNEIWNWQFTQAGYVLNNAIGHPNRYVSEDLAAINPEPAGHPEKDAYMMDRTFKIWKEVFSDEDSDRIIRVAAVQHGWPDNTRRVLNWLFDKGDGCDVVSPGGYFSFDGSSAHNAWVARANPVVYEMLESAIKENATVDPENESEFTNRLTSVLSNLVNNISSTGSNSVPEYLNGMATSLVNDEVLAQYIPNVTTLRTIFTKLNVDSAMLKLVPPAEILDSALAKFNRGEKQWTSKNAEYARAHEVGYVVYEGGQHMQPQGQKVWWYNNSVWQAQVNRKIYDMYMENFKHHITPEINCELFVAFSYMSNKNSKYGSWGHLEGLHQVGADNYMDIAPKYQALLDANNPKIQLICIKQTNGVLSAPGSGVYEVKTGDDFTFTLIIEDGYDASDLSVKLVSAVGEETIYPNDEEIYIVPNIQTSFDIAITGVVKQLVVTLPETAGVTTDPASGNHIVLQGTDFSFTLTLDDAYDKSIPVVKAVAQSGEEVLNLINGEYVITDVTSDVAIEITGVEQNPTGLSGVKTVNSIWTSDGKLFISSSASGIIHIFNSLGIVHSVHFINEGLNEIGLADGFYIVRVENQSYKVIVK